ncbi:dTDP-4-dehydrorhamnose reductase [Clostridium saccharoperbutylacetonicum]|uniref:dTDP-4-dehydrorhamnose reductase n=1 Tax=Clostridium saccharoperbutylacetonicum N1-4(HMT) TaxID=931276 RepID=M1N708_9CLOT|nr:dTDP-4-dehydrorhamnose reductase [Clostridium saccharoperbutylacetonicum]AGF59172.1 dTDP-4-dehydrorhamnose reductase [Clostridium saccharoperbutylacetonicum N1-4(HMT)]NRT60041.1 dTDP-4-dehydrorhamnose reductase [Clostridium saccharoperbutylacetonicum]NSB23353.1 dTDP-4-dehydrorhamnose reductase [Clostridium saccharoperbutylacetonicum]NSB42723.1 dTDP-4-dehydrorhamnose reductase [Clostridium saccharoperbutylacetonicum]
MILVTGVNGQLGFDIVKELNRRNIECIGIDRAELDITDANAVRQHILKLKPECVIHCAAYTAVDRAEDEEEACTKVNVYGTENIAKACKEIDAKMIYISTDYVFDGKGDTSFEVDGKIEPHSVYGKTKYEGELKVKEVLDKYFIVRISWVFGVNGNNFIKTMLRLGKEKESLNVVCDQIGSPTYTFDLAPLLCDMAISEKYGVYHATNEGFCSWAEFAAEIMKKADLGCKINPIPTSEYPAKAERPLNSRLSKKSLLDNGFNLLPDWKNALERYLIELK